MKVRWAEEHSRFTALFERLAILVLKETSIEGAGKVLRISWDEAWQIMGRAADRGQKRKTRRAEIEAIAADILDPYLASIREHVPKSEKKLVFDRYHLMAHMIKAVDSVRKQEHRELKEEGRDLLTGTKYLEHFKIAIFFHCGGLYHLPDTHKNVG